jgi:predicted nucleic acid-binding protein
LAKRYLHEAESDRFEIFTAQTKSASISRLTLVEFRCLLARRRRNRNIGIDNEQRALAEFEEDIVGGFLEIHPLQDRHAMAARDLLIKLATIPLRTLDAFHLAIAIDIGSEAVATADKAFAQAVRAVQLHLEWFGAD